MTDANGARVRNLHPPTGPAGGGPAKPSGWESLGKVIAGLAVIAILTWFLQLGLTTAHDLYPAVAAPTFWQALNLFLGLIAVGRGLVWFRNSKT